MVQLRLGGRLAVGCLITWGGIASAQTKPAVTPQQLLALRPKQDAVTITTPTDAELAGCKVEVVNGANNTSAYVLRDARGQVVRRFADTKGTGKVDTKSYYLDGQEVYREIDTNGTQTPDQFRWFGMGGMRWGVDVDKNGSIDGWQQISAEEVGQEILRAVATKNVARLQALAMSEQELKGLQLSPQETTRIRESIAKIPAQFQATVAKLPAMNETVRWQHFESQTPQCVPAELVGAKTDLVRYKSATVLYQLGDKHDWLQTGELIQVGRAWRIIAGPTTGHDVGNNGGLVAGAGDGIDLTDEKLKVLIEKLQELDKGAAVAAASAATSVKYHLERAALLEQIIGRMKTPQQADQWIRQVADCYATAAQVSGPSDDAAFKRLVDLKDRCAKAQPGSPLTGYVAYREIQAEYAMKLSRPGGKPEDLGKVQEALRDRMKKFVEEYPTAEDAPDALLQLGMVCEFMNKETEAKGYYALMAKNFAQHPLAAKAQGALKRLSIDGQVMDLSGPELANGQPFDIRQMTGKVVVVYYWASWNQQCLPDFAKLTSIVNTHGSKGVELVCINLDNTAAEATGAVQKMTAPGKQLFQVPGGLDSPLAVQHGVMVLPSMFLVGKDGKVVSHTIQMSSLEDEIKKLTEK
jgi:hypothetical protein